MPIGGEPIEVDYTLAEEGLARRAGRQAVAPPRDLKEVREKKVPALDDEMAKDTGEAETLDGPARRRCASGWLEADETAHQERDDAAR